VVAAFDGVELALIQFFCVAVDRKLRKDSKYLSAGIQFNIQEIAGGLASRAVSLFCPLPANRSDCLQGDCFGVNVLVPGVDPIVE
jgi:hypothetical protein